MKKYLLLSVLCVALYSCVDHDDDYEIETPKEEWRNDTINSPTKNNDGEECKLTNTCDKMK